MPLANVSNAACRPPSTADALTAQRGIQGASQTDVEAAARDLANHQVEEGGKGPTTPGDCSELTRPTKGWLQLAALKGRDPTHIIIRRFTALAALSLDLEADHIERLGNNLKQMVQANDDGVEEFNDNMMSRLGRYRRALVLVQSFREVLSFDDPNSALLDNVLSSARASFCERQPLHLDASDDDWASLFSVDKLEQMITFWPHRPCAQRLLQRFGPKPEASGELELTRIPWGYARFAIIGIFNCFVGVFVAAPIAIQALGVTTPVGEVMVYLAFVIVAGFLIQTLVDGFTKQLLVYLTYAGVMAAIMRQRS
ncbi:hypothetical protein FZEAL_8832 [Fusarium zealandicum]|uniref:Uncharacterized protein n=1 Tax=Fusarium zealandicum TaxID=1053134 RepID=A0A8H4UD97_9HYPO|nr:hypothetical protein FZEAL_8832 [Fusarium zealandicum]